MKTIRLNGAPPVEITLRRSARARRLSLRVSSLDGRVTMTVPQRLPVAEALAFADDRREWILRAQAGTRSPETIDEGCRIPVGGELRRVTLFDRRAPALGEETLFLPRRAPGRAAAAFLKLRARDHLTHASDRHAGTLGVRYAAIALRDTRTRWGSCTSEGRLMFSWRLAMAPPAVLNYVAAHEVAHLVRMDHSSAFWRVVEGLDPDWRDHRRWLRTRGPELHAWRFED